MTQFHRAPDTLNDVERAANPLPEGISPPSYQLLDPRTLGRPVHLLHRFAAQLREDLSELFRNSLNRRYRADFQVADVSIDATARTVPPGRWQGYATSNGRMGCALDRILVLNALVYRYGLNGEEAASGSASEKSPETASEERLATMLGKQLADTLAIRIERGLDAIDGETPSPPEAISLGPISVPRSTCLIKATVRERVNNIEGHLYIALDDSWMAMLLRNLAPTRSKRTSTVHASPLADRLNFKLVARLLQKELTLDELLNIRVGDVIPVNLRAADLLIDSSRLMTATVAEHKGKLCLTSFENTK